MAFSISILILIVGFISLGTLPIEQYPDIAPPTVCVSATYTGASADAVMKSVIQPLEEAINGVENMTLHAVYCHELRFCRYIYLLQTRDRPPTWLR